MTAAPIRAILPRDLSDTRGRTVSRPAVLIVTILALAASVVSSINPPEQRNHNFRMKRELRDAWRMARGEGVRHVLSTRTVGDDVGISLMLAAVLRTQDVSAMDSPPTQAPRLFIILQRAIFILTATLLAGAIAVYIRPAVGLIIGLLPSLSPNWRFISFSDDVYLYPAAAIALALTALILLRRRSRHVWWLALICVVGIVGCQIMRNISILCMGLFIVALFPRFTPAAQVAPIQLRRRLLICLGLTLLLSTAATRAVGSSGHVFWHPLHCGLGEFGGHEDADSLTLPWFVPPADVPLDATAIDDWRDPRCFARAEKLAPEVRRYSPAYEAICRDDYFNLWRRYPAGMAATYVRRLVNIVTTNPAQAHTSDSSTVSSAADTAALLVLAACIGAAVWLRIGRPVWHLVIGLAPCMIPPLMTHSGYIMYNAPARIGLYVLIAVVMVELATRPWKRGLAHLRAS